MSCPEPGIYPNVTEDDYNSWEAVRQSDLRYLMHSPARYHQKVTNPEVLEDVGSGQQKNFDAGHLAHMVVFQPQLVESEVTIIPGTYPVEKATTADVDNGYAEERGDPCDRPWGGGTSKWCKEWKEDHEGQLCVKREDVQVFEHIAAKMNQDPKMAPFLGLESKYHEVGIVWDDPRTGIRCKAKLDSWPNHGSIIGDLKTCGKSAEPEAFVWHAMDMGYFRQAAFYMDGIETLLGPEFNQKTATFRFLLCEKMCPWRVCWIDLRRTPADSDNDPMLFGRLEYRHLLAVLKQCRDTNHYPEWHHNPNGELILEENHKNKMERILTRLT